MNEPVKYITIGSYISYDTVWMLPESEKSANKVMNIYGPSNSKDKLVNPVSLLKAVAPEEEYLSKGSVIPEVSLQDVENFIKGSAFIMITLSADRERNYTEAKEVIRLAQKLKVPFHIIIAKPPVQFLKDDIMDIKNKEIEAMTQNVTKDDVYSLFNTLPRDTPTADAFNQVSKKLAFIMQEIIKEKLERR